MTIYETQLVVDGLYIEDVITWEWFEEKLRLNQEVFINSGYIVSIDILKEYYIPAFRSFIDFEYYDSSIYNDLLDVLDYIVSFVAYYYDSSFIYIVGL